MFIKIHNCYYNYNTIDYVVPIMYDKDNSRAYYPTQIPKNPEDRKNFTLEIMWNMNSRQHYIASASKTKITGEDAILILKKLYPDFKEES